MGSHRTPTSHHESENMHVGVRIGQFSVNINPMLNQSNLTLKEKLDRLPLVHPQPTIFKVCNDLRRVKNEAYDPKIVAIGPYHRHKDNLRKMETHKLRYLHSLLGRTEESIMSCFSVIERLEPEARKCYAEPIALNSTEFTEMLILDGCFIIEFALRCNDPNLRNENDHIFDMVWVRENIKYDLILFENQVPFFILDELFYFMAVARNVDHTLADILLKIYDLNSSPTVDSIENPTDIKHLLELIHQSLLHERGDQEPEETPLRTDGKLLSCIGCATSLAESNVKFGWTTTGKKFQMDFENGSMQLSSMTIEDTTESSFRNLIAYEHYFLGDTKPRHVSDYARLMDCLINTEEDVKLLIKCGVIESWVGSEKDVADMFNRLCEGVFVSDECFIYKRQFEKVNEHCNRRRNRWIAKLKQNHFNSPWAIISIVGAFLLLGLTIVQTVFAILN